MLFKSNKDLDYLQIKVTIKDNDTKNGIEYSHIYVSFSFLSPAPTALPTVDILVLAIKRNSCHSKQTSLDTIEEDSGGKSSIYQRSELYAVDYEYVDWHIVSQWVART